jgi:hypothetical protein
VVAFPFIYLVLPTFCRFCHAYVLCREYVESASNFVCFYGLDMFSMSDLEITSRLTEILEWNKIRFCDDGTLIEILCFWRLCTVLYVFETLSCFYLKQKVSETGLCPCL